jgi:mono/diheme cytochrome c family protein
MLDFFRRFIDGRMLFESIESRITVGIIAFVGTIIVTGWVAINENARMAAFDRQFLARSIERGGHLYSSNCSTCHSADSLGASGIAPALRNPQLFGVNFFADIDLERSRLNSELNNTTTPPSEARREEILARLDALQIETDARTQTMQVAIDAGYDPSYNPFFPNEISDYQAAVDSAVQSNIDAVLRVVNAKGYSRIQNVQWGGGLRNFIQTTLISGRPVSANYWPQPMAAWSQRAGGPLRDDQIQDLTNYIMNYDKGADWTIDDLLVVRQFAIYPIDPSSVVMGELQPAVGVDVAAAVAMIEPLTGNSERGQQLYNSTIPATNGGRLGCSGCHNGVAAPATEVSWQAAQGERLAATGDPDAVTYIVHSILLPNDYTVPGFAGNMPLDFGNRLTAQDLADIVAYFQSYDS